jgi:multidrug efflux system membrane fusion protein
LPSDPHEHPITDTHHLLPAEGTSEGYESKPRGSFRFIVWGIILLLFAGVFYWVIHHKEQAAQPSRRGQGGTATVVPATVKEGSIGVYQDAIGTVTPVYTATITAQVTGVIVAVHYHEGQLVRKGQPLVDIDSRQYQANLATAKGTLLHDQGVLAEAQMDLDRYKTAWEKNAIARQQYEDQEKVVIQAQGTVKQDEGTVQYDQVQVAFCHIVSPINGRVGLRLVDPGNLVTANATTPLVVVTQEDPITVVFTVAEDVLSQVLPRMKEAKLNVDAYDRTSQHLIVSGTLASLDNQVDTTTGTVKARAQFDNKDGKLYPNEFVNVKLLVNTLQNVTLLPTSAIQHNSAQTFVYAIDNDKVKLQPVTVGVTDGDTSQVTGVNAGQVVANSSFDKLQANATVRLADANGGGGKGGGGKGGGKGKNGGGKGGGGNGGGQ